MRKALQQRGARQIIFAYWASLQITIIYKQYFHVLKIAFTE